MYWYVLFVKAGKENKVEQYLSKNLNTKVSIPFIPLQEIIFRRAGSIKREIRFLFPGYIFIESILSDKQFLQDISPVINRCSDIIGLLKYSDTEISIKESEKNMLKSLCDSEYCIGASFGVIEGDKIHITDGPLKGLESIIRKVNRHRRDAVVEIEIMGEVRFVNVALEVVEKVVCRNY